MNYSELQTVAFEYADCSADTSTTARYDDFLRLVEARLNRVTFTREQEGESYTTLVDDTYLYALPTDFGRLRSLGVKVDLNTASETAQFVPPEFYDTYVASNGEVYIYTTYGSNVKIWPVVDSYILEILYYKKIPALTAVAPTNWVSSNHPDLYLYGLVTEICSFRKDFETSKLWEERFFGTLTLLADQNDKTKWSGPLFTTIAA
jgi:hypothetical protein